MAAWAKRERVGSPRGSLRDANTHATYDLVHSAKKAILIEHWPSPVRQRLRYPTPAVQRGDPQVVNGLLCVPVVIKTPPPFPEGKSCNSIDYDLHVRAEATLVGSDGMQHHFLREMFNINIGAMPPANSVVLPPDFAMLERGAH